jgi:cation-transporting ATPase 13A3/4/5
MYSHHGYRVLAIAYKSIENTDVPREEAECNLNFLGFIVFENKLKPGTTTVINTLSKAKIRQIMCTGDNLLTSISVARQCSLVSQNHKTFVPRFLIGQSHEEDAVIEWYDVDNVDNKLNSETLIPIDYGAAYNYHLAITGDVFQWMLDFSDDDTFDRMLVMCQIFARMSPDLKHFLVENLQSLGYCVGFCGDGTNDCGALKSADAGLSLSEAEASVAAPFTSKQKDLDCVLRLIREGRAALVTSFCCFKYMALYSLIQFTSVILLYSLKQNVNDFQFMYIDLALIIPVAVFMGQTGPHPQIHRKQPTAKLLSKKVLTSVFGQIIIQGLMQYIAFRWVQSQPWYVPGNVDIANEMYESFENTIVFMVSSYQYLIVAVVFTVGPPYQESILKNTPYIITLSLLLAANLAVTFLPSNVIPFDLVQVPVSARIFVVIIAASDLVMSWVCEIYIFPRAASIIGDFAERVMYRLYEQSPIEAVDIHTASKMYKWSQNGKRYKIIEKLIE